MHARLSRSLIRLHPSSMHAFSQATTILQASNAHRDVCNGTLSIFKKGSTHFYILALYSSLVWPICVINVCVQVHLNCSTQNLSAIGGSGSWSLGAVFFMMRATASHLYSLACCQSQCNSRNIEYSDGHV
jgi:hypothetical protein